MNMLNLYVWEGVLEDYSAGIVVVLAESEESAWELLKISDNVAWWRLQGQPDDRDYKGISPDATRPMLVTEPAAFVVWGGS